VAGSSDLIALAEFMAYFPAMEIHCNIPSPHDFLKSDAIAVSDLKTMSFRHN